MIQIICFICMTNTSTWLFDTLIFDKFITHCPDMGQSLSICINYYQWASINVNKHQSSLISITQHQSAYHSLYQSASVSVSQRQSAYQSVYQSASISIGQHIDQHINQHQWDCVVGANNDINDLLHLTITSPWLFDTPILDNFLTHCPSSGTVCTNFSWNVINEN